MNRRTTRLAVFVFAVWCIAFHAAAQPMGKSKEYQSLNSDLYKISIQKDGRLDVSLATDVPVITDVFPMVWFEGEDEPERMQTKGGWTERYLVEDKLGQGQGIHHQYKGTLWSLRAYPTRTFFAVQLGYTNETKRPVRIKALLPWCVGAPAKGMLSLGPATNTARILSGFTSGVSAFGDGAAHANDALAVFNSATGQSLIAGFLTQDYARGVFDVGGPAAENKKNPAGLSQFRAMSVFDEPIELAPGETLQSEVLYLAISESEPVVGLQRYARAVQVVNGLSGPEHDPPVHAWMLRPEDAIDLPRVAELLNNARAIVPPQLIGNVLVGRPDGPETTAELITADLANTIRAAGFEPVLWYDPFDTPANLRYARPDNGRLDLSADYSIEVLESVGRSFRDKGFHAIAGIRLDGPSAYSSLDRTRAAVKALRAGLGEGGRLFGTEPSLLAATLFDGVVTAAADRRFLAPQPARHAVYFNKAIGSLDAVRAAVTAATLTKCSLLIPLEALEDNAAATIAGRVLPSPQTAARPIDLFAQPVPRAFHLTTKTPDGDLHVAAVMNWDGANPVSTTLPLGRIGFSPGAYHTVYDYWQQKYLGTAEDSLNVTVPARGSLVLVFRPVLSRPMLASIGTNLGQDWPGLRTVEWSPQSRMFTVVPEQPASMEGIPLPNAEARYTLAVPQPYRLVRVTSTSAQAPTSESTNASATIIFPTRMGALQGFSAEFSTTP